MRILIAISKRDTLGGAETYVRDLHPALEDRGHEIGWLFEHDAVGAYPIDQGATSVWCTDRQTDILRELTDWQPDVLYLQGLSDVALEEKLTSVFPTAWFMHTYFGACISAKKRFAFPGAEPCSLAFGAACLALYFPRRCGGLNPVTMVREYLKQRRRLQLIVRCPSVLVASRHMREEYIRNGVPPERVHILPLFPTGTSPDAEPPRERPLSGRLLFVGRLTDVKGGDKLVEAAALASRSLGRPLQVTFAGEGPARLKIEQLARALDVRVDMRGWVDMAERTALMRGADLLVVPSLWPEPFGLVGLEAGCVGLPAVAYDVGGIRDWLHSGESGELAPGSPPTVAGLADALVRALSDPKTRVSLARGAWSVAQQFTLMRHCDQLERHLESIAGSRLVEGRT
jgi:glycosyltransferase involved in cell wall biosynthesis